MTRQSNKTKKETTKKNAINKEFLRRCWVFMDQHQTSSREKQKNNTLLKGKNEIV